MNIRAEILEVLARCILYPELTIPNFRQIVGFLSSFDPDNFDSAGGCPLNDIFKQCIIYQSQNDSSEGTNDTWTASPPTTSAPGSTELYPIPMDAEQILDTVAYTLCTAAMLGRDVRSTLLRIVDLPRLVNSVMSKHMLHLSYL